MRGSGMLTGMMGFVSAEPVNKGWSNDKKFRVVSPEGETFLLRLSDAAEYNAKKKEYEIIQKYAGLGFSMSQPAAFGMTEDRSSVYMLLSWVEGTDLEEVLPALPDEKQYQVGREAGTILKLIHSLRLEPSDVPTSTKKEKKLKQLSLYEQSSLRINGDKPAIQFVRENIDFIWKEAPVYQHGDYHPGNLIYTPEGKIGVIDFNRWEVGDPYEEFYKLESFGRELSVPYCIGQIDSYFQDHIPVDFWKALAVYVAHASLYSIKWAEKFGQEEIDGMIRRCMVAFDDYDGFSSVVPKWYHKWRK